MKINNSTKKSLLIIALAMASTTYQTQAAPIEHIGDRYIMHIPEMELTGEESLLDVLMMCPEVISLDGNNIIGGDPFANLYGKFVIRIDNQEYGLDYATFLHHFKAREIETIKVCQNAEVMKGCSSLKKVIDITLRKKENGTTGRWGLFGDTYGGAKGIVSVISQQDKLRVLSHVEGNFQRTSSSDKDAYQGISSTTVNHYSHEGAKLNLLWTPTAKDVLEIDAMQTYTRNHFTHTPADYVRAYHLQADYTRTLADNGSSILFTLGAEHISDNGRTQEETQTAPYQNHSTYPFMVVEYATPVITPDLWITAGFEGGLSPSRRTASPVTPTIPTIRISTPSWITTSASGDSWQATVSASSTSVLSRLRRKSTGSIPRATISTRRAPITASRRVIPCRPPTAAASSIPSLAIS